MEHPPTVIILTFCDHPALAYGAMLVFKTLRVGFPTATVLVLDNGSHPDVRPKIEKAATAAECTFVATERHPFVDHYRWALLEQMAAESIVLLDPDVVFWRSVEDWRFTGLMAGRLIPDLLNCGVRSMARLHPSLLWVPSVSLFRSRVNAVGQRSNGSVFWDTLSEAYHAHREDCQVFSPEQMDCYDHLFYGSHFPAISPGLRDSGLTHRAHVAAASGNYEELRGLWRKQEEYFRSLRDESSLLPETIIPGMAQTMKELGNAQEVRDVTADDIWPLITGIHGQLEKAEEFMLQRPQVECSVVHHFGPGVCVREVTVPAGTWAVGHRQRYSHLNIMLRGSVVLFNDDGSTRTVTAPTIFTGPPGKKAGLVLEEMVWLNVYATELKTPDEVESFFIEKSDEWQRHHTESFALAMTFHESDREDYLRVLEEVGISHETAVAQSENDADRVTVHSPRTRVADSPIHGQGLFVMSPIQAGELICPARIGGMRSQAGRFTNHSVNPNAEMVLTPTGDVNLVAIKFIPGCRGGGLGTEVTIDYRSALALRECAQ